YTRSEIALPLIVGGEVLGALDVQSTKEAAFSEADIETLQAMANQVAIALQNARLFRNLTQNLQEMQAIQRQYLRRGWGDFLRTQRIRYEVGEPTSTESSPIEIPLALREEILGRIALHGNIELSEDEKEWLEALISQTALALESARILDENVRQAELEQMAAQVIHRTRQALETQTILRTAAKELQRTLRLPEVILHFGPPPPERK
ncbi:MAG: GAF domain-containing protein, partial [Anaerolineales bacterium]